MPIIEQLDPDVVRIIHPCCGAVLHITNLAAHGGYLDVEAICYRCDRYIHAQIKTSLDPSADEEAEAISTDPHVSLAARTAKIRRLTVIAALAHANGNVAKAARRLEISRESVYKLIKTLGIPS